MTDEWDDTVAALSNAHEIGPTRAYLVVIRGKNVGETHLVTGPNMVIGRAAGADLRLDDEGVSRFHCKLRHVNGAIVVEDLASRNGTFCNGDRVVPDMRALAEGDRLQIGTTTILRFTHVDDASDDDANAEEPDLVRDPLTNTYSRRYLVDKLEREVEFALAHKAQLSLVMIHIDGFSEIYANHGQAITDQLTTLLAQHILENVRKEDVVARIADGEFAMLSRSPSPADTFMLAERLRASGASLAAVSPQGPVHITLSVGVASLHELRIETSHDFLVAAGSVLHRARTTGGNRVVLGTHDSLQEPRLRKRL